MDPSHRSFTNLMNQDSPNQYSENSSQHSPPTQFPTNLHQSQYPFTQPDFFHNFNPFGPPGNLPPYARSPSFQSVQQQGGWMQPTASNFQGVGLQGHVHSPNQLFGAAAGMPPSVLRNGPWAPPGAGAGAAVNSSSLGSETSSPCPARQEAQKIIPLEESSGSSEEEPRKGMRINWNEEENLRLLSAWLEHSIDPIDGIDKKSEYYWKAVAADFNKNGPKNGHKRTIKQLKTHWGGVKREIAKFCGVYSRARSTYCSGQSDDMLMDKVRAWYKKENQDKPFTLEYMWREVKDLPKWRRVIQAEGMNNKRTKISESGAYTSSSNQDTEEETRSKEKRPEGQKKAKARLKGKAVAGSPLGNQPSQNMVLYHEAVSIKAAALFKSAEATAKSAEAKKEQTRMEKYQTYLKLLYKDTSQYSEAKLKRHEAILDLLAKELEE
ncbi:hypothetical protein ACP70R_037111 [Stipagrostis hirtigluma subsp. patula]